MKPWILPLVLSVSLLAPQAGFACGEGIYTMGEGARQRGYLAPHPATVLVYDDRGTVPESTRAVYRGLVRAGHKLEVARDQEQLAAALRAHRYDVVIADYDQIGIIGKQADPATKARLLPILTDAQRGAMDWRQRFRYSLTQGASLGQYLKLIDRLARDRA